MLTELPPGAEELLHSLGLLVTNTVDQLPGGANNRVFRVTGGSRVVVLKAYFHHPADTRDRLGTEFQFLRFAWECGARAIPEALACDPEHHLAVYEWLPGRRLHPDELNDDHVAQALKLYQTINQHRHKPAATVLPNGSEACFSLDAHLRTVEHRISRLQHLAPDAPLFPKVQAFVTTALGPAWQAIQAEIQEQATQFGHSLTAELPPAERRLSPSDFGFHNALFAPDQPLRFIDFEYAGWDDPAKVVCDFFCQPAVPVPARLFPQVSQVVTADLADPVWHQERIALLWPAYQIKWVCIMLNDFLPVEDQRRRFSGAAADRQARQFAQAQAALAALARPHPAHSLRGSLP